MAVGFVSWTWRCAPEGAMMEDPRIESRHCVMKAYCWARDRHGVGLKGPKDEALETLNQWHAGRFNRGYVVASCTSREVVLETTLWFCDR